MNNSPAISIQVAYKLIDGEDFETKLEVYNYTDSSFAINISEHFGKAYKENFKEIGGIYKPSLKQAPHKGWIFSRGKYNALQELVKKIIDGEVRGKVPYEYKKKQEEKMEDGPLGLLPSFPPVISVFKQFFEKVNGVFSSEVQMFVEGSNRYVWGPSETVDKMMEETNLLPICIFNNLSHKFVLAKQM
jgi:hypothetical protein